MSQDEITLYCLAGEALCAIQHLEDALSHAIVLKKEVKRPYSISKIKANEHLKKYRSFTLGQALRITKKEELFTKELQQELDKFLNERNWLIHKSIAQNRDEWDLNINRDKLFIKIKTITNESQRLQILVEEDLMTFSEAKGVNTSKARTELEKHRKK